MHTRREKFPTRRLSKLHPRGDVGDNSRMNPFEERGNDENQQVLKDPLHIPVGPITGAISKKDQRST